MTIHPCEKEVRYEPPLFYPVWLARFDRRLDAQLQPRQAWERLR